MRTSKAPPAGRLLSFILALCLIAGLLPMTALAASYNSDPATWPAPDALYTAPDHEPVRILLDYSLTDEPGIHYAHYCETGAELTPEIVKATATTSGYVKYTCSVCGSWARVNVPALTLSAFTLDPAYQDAVDDGVEYCGSAYTLVYNVAPTYQRFVGTKLNNNVSVTTVGSYGVEISVDSDIYNNVKLNTAEQLVIRPKAIPWTATFNSKVFDGTSLLDGVSVSYEDINGDQIPAAISACLMKVENGELVADPSAPVPLPVAAGAYAIGATITDTNYAWQTENGMFSTVYTLAWVFPATNPIYVGDTIQSVSLITGNSTFVTPFNWTVDTSYTGFDSSRPGTTYIMATVTRSSPAVGHVLIPVTVNARHILNVERVSRTAPLGTAFSALNLPATVTVTAEGGAGNAQTVSGVPVTWNSAGYDPDVLTQTVQGTLDLSGFPQLSGENAPAVTATVNLTYGSVEAPSISNYSKVYDRTSSALPLPAMPTGIQSVTLSYKGTANNGNPYVSNVAPVNAGSYTATVSFVMEPGYPQLDSIPVNYTIEKAAQTCTVPVLAASTTSSLTLEEAEGAEYSKDGEVWQDSPVFRNLNAGTSYTLYQRMKATENGNYDASPAVSAEFVTEYNTVDPADLDLQPQTYAYTGNPILYRVPPISHVTRSTVVYDVDGVETASAPADAGAYPVTISFTMQAGAAQLEPVTSTLTITKTEQAAPSAPKAVSTGTNAITVSAIPGAVFSIDGGTTWQASTIFDGLDPDTAYTIQAKYPESRNRYESPMSSAGIRTARRSSVAATVESAVYIYDGTPKALVADVPFGCTAVVQTFTGTRGTVYGPTTAEPVNPGVYNVKVSYTMADGYAELQPQYATLTIHKATPETPPAPVVLDVTDHSITVQVLDGMTYSIDGGATWQTDGTFTGLSRDTTYEIKVKAVETDCYKELEGPSTRQATEKTVVEFTGFEDQTVDYTGSAQPYILPRTVTGIAAMTITGYDGAYSFPVNVGDYTVNIAFVPADGYTLPETVPTPVLHIVRGTGSTSAIRPILNDEAVTYTGAPQRYHGADGIEGVATVLLTYTGADGTVYPETTTPPTDAGTYTVSVSLFPDANHSLAGGDHTAVLTIRKAGQDTPLAVLESATADTLTVSQIPGAEYSIDGGSTWQNSNVFTGLEPDTAYTVLVRLKGNGNYLPSGTRPVSGRTASEELALLDLHMPDYRTVYNGTRQPYPYTDLLEGMDGVLSVSVMYVGTLEDGRGYERSDAPVDAGHYTVRFTVTAADTFALDTEQICADMVIAKAMQTMADAPEIESATAFTITLKAVQGAEYSMDGGVTWQDSPRFTGLEPDTGYTFTQRLKETDNMTASPSRSVDGRTAEDTGLRYEIDHWAKIIRFDPAVVEVSTDYTWSDTLRSGDTVVPGSTIYIRVLDDGDGVPGPVVIEVLPECPDAPDVQIDTRDHTMNTTGEMEYSTDGGQTWKECEPDMDVSDLMGQTILVRVAAGADHFAGEPAEVHVPTQAETPEVTLDIPAETVSTTTAMEYSTDGGETWTPCTGPLDISAFTGQDILVRDRGGDSAFPGDPVTVTIPQRRPAPSVEVNDKSRTIRSEDGTEWSTNGGKTWTKLTKPLNMADYAGKTLLFRYSATDDELAGSSTTVLIPTHTDGPVLVFNPITETVNTTTGMEYSIDGGKTWISCTGPLDLSSYAGRSILVRTAGAGDTEPSDPTTIYVPARRSAPAVGHTDETRKGYQDGALTNTDRTMEYRTAGGRWLPITGTSVKNLAPGSYEVRYAATAANTASNILTVTIAAASTSAEENDSSSLLHLLNRESHMAYIIGRTESLAAPEESITRAEIAVILYRLLTPEAKAAYSTTYNRFSDVDSAAWYATAVSTLARIGVIAGNRDGTFAPGRIITRAELATILARFCADTNVGAPDRFPDISGSWARSYINRAGLAGLVYGFTDGTFRPNQAVSRAEAIAMMNRILDRSASERTVLKGYRTFDDVPANAWYYWDIVEASNGHSYVKDDTTEWWTALR